MLGAPLAPRRSRGCSGPLPLVKQLSQTRLGLLIVIVNFDQSSNVAGYLGSGHFHGQFSEALFQFSYFRLDDINLARLLYNLDSHRPRATPIRIALLSLFRLPASGLVALPSANITVSWNTRVNRLRITSQSVRIVEFSAAF